MSLGVEIPVPGWAYLAFIYYATFWVFSVPLTSILVRFRAYYKPKGLKFRDVGKVEQEDADTSVEDAGPVVRSYFEMFARVYRQEGLSGLFKGFMPNFIFKIFLSVTPLGPRDYHHDIIQYPADSIVFIVPLVLFSVPSMTIMYRAMTTASHLSLFKPVAGLRSLLTPHERANPFRLYKCSGLIFAWTFHIYLVSVFTGSARSVIFPAIVELIYSRVTGTPGHEPPWLDYPAPYLFLMGVYVVVGSILLSPLEVILIRLSIQRNSGFATNKPCAESASSKLVPRSDVHAADANEDVVFVCPDTDPYTGMIDCATRIVMEEGWATLYRGWWITFLFGGFQSSLL